MPFEGYLSFGGNEVVNNERARGLSQSATCPMYWLKGPQCDSLQDALGDAEYDFANMPDAPWYDPSMPDLTARFYGSFALSVSGLNDSTRSAPVTEGIDDGAQIGRTRRGARSARVRTLLIAKGRDALDYGVAWLNSALNPNACGQHGTGCGTTDLEYFADCPPPRGTVPDFTPWEPIRVNGMVNPKPTTYAGSGWAQPSAGSITADGVTSTLTSTTTPYMFTAPRDGGAVLGRVYAFRAKVVAAMAPGSSATSVQIRVHKRVGNAYYTPTAGAIFVPADGLPHEVAFYWLATVNIASADGFELSAVGNGTALAGTTLSMDEVLIEDVGITIPSAPPQAFFYAGSTPPDDLTRYLWVGTVENSPSQMEVRSIIERPRTDEEYAAIVDPLRRYLHNVAVTSGPLERELMNVGEFWGQVFEWTFTAGRPWVYSATRPVNLPTTPSIVIQDTPYNLVPYPSAELAGVDVDAAINYSLNPSVETNATGWTSGADGVAITAAMLAAGRVTGELQAVGTASYRVVFTATGAGSSGAFWAQQEVDVSARPAGSRVSLSYWAAELLMAGTPVRPDIDFIAFWRSGAGGTILRTDNLGTVPVNGGALSIKSILPPVGATHVLVRAQARLTSWPAGTVLRLYADALAVTVP